MYFSRYPHWSGGKLLTVIVILIPTKVLVFFPRFLCLWSACGRCVWPAILTPSPHPTSVWLESPGPMTQLMVVSGTVNSSYCCSIGRFSHLGVKEFFSHIQIHNTVGTLNASYLRTAAATLKAFGALQSCTLSQPQTSGFNGPCEKVSFIMEKNENIRGARTLEYLCGSTSCKQICNFVGYNSTILGHLLHQAAILFTKGSHRNDNKLISVNSHWSMCQPGCLTLFPLQWMIVNHFSLIPSK